MANKLIIKNSLEPQQEVIDTAGGKTYTSFQTEQNTGNQGGTYQSTFTDAKAIKYVGVADVKTDGGAALTNGTTAFEGTATTTGVTPSSSGVKAFYVKFDSVLGTCNWVKVFYGSVEHAQLALGESVCIPLIGGALSNCKIEVDDYSDGVHEATVTVVLIGD
jgi:hypothetical protein